MTTRQEQLCISKYLNTKITATLPRTTSGYKQIYVCTCGKKFRSRQQFERHAEYAHNDPELYPDTMIVNGKYIEGQCKQCHTKILIFGHRGENIEFCNHTKKIMNSCYLRICPKCDQTRRYRYAKKYTNTLLSFWRISVLTLTFCEGYVLDRKEKHTRELQVRNFIKRLERKSSYELHYIRVLELSDRQDGTFHYHYHVLIDIPYISQEKLKQMWNETTGATILDIRCLRDKDGVPIGITWGRLPEAQKTKQAISYVTKYLSNPLGKKHDADGGYIADYEAYAKYIYGSHFIETRNASFRSCNGQNSSTEGLICPCCKYPMEYLETELIENVGNVPDS